MPGPVSRTARLTSPAAAPVETASVTAPRVRELDAVAEQVEEDLAQLLPVAVTAAGTPSAMARSRARFFSLARPLHEHHDVLDQLVQVEDAAFHLDLPGFDPRIVEDVVEDAEQVLARRAHDPDLLALALVQRAVGHQPQHAEHPVHRRADLVGSWWRETRTWRGWPVRRGRGRGRGSAPPPPAGHWPPSTARCGSATSLSSSSLCLRSSALVCLRSSSSSCLTIA